MQNFWETEIYNNFCINSLKAQKIFYFLKILSSILHSKMEKMSTDQNETKRSSMINVRIKIKSTIRSAFR